MKNLVLFFQLFTILSCSSGQVSKKENKADLYFRQGGVLLNRNEYAKALGILLKAKKLNPRRDDVLSALALAYYYKGSQSQAIESLKKAIKLAPKITEYKNNLGTIYLETNQLDQAETLYKEVIKDLSYENSFLAYYNLGILEEKRSNPANARGYFSQSAKDGNYCVAYYKLGQYSFDEARYEEATGYLKKSTLRGCFQNPQHHLLLATAYLKSNKKSLAKIKFKEIIQSHPESTQAKEALKYMSRF